MTPEIKKEIDNLKREIANLKRVVSDGQIKTIMNVKDDANTYRAVQRALVTSDLTIGGGSNRDANASSILTLNARNKGFLPPRTNDLTIIPNPVEGMMAYATDYEAMMVYNGQAWGMTLPRYTNTQMLAIPTPLEGMIVYNTTHDGPEWYANGTWGFVLPTVTTTQRDALTTPVQGQMVFNTTTDKLNVYANGAWEQVTSA